MTNLPLYIVFLVDDFDEDNVVAVGWHTFYEDAYQDAGTREANSPIPASYRVYDILKGIWV